MQQIIRHLFKVDTLDEVSRERLEELVEEYPSFSVARYLLSRKLGIENADHFTQETQKTNLYFTNPFWLYWLLEETVPEKGWAIGTEAVDGILENGHPTNGNGSLIATGETVELSELPPWGEDTVEQPEEKQEEPAVEEIVGQAAPAWEMPVVEAPIADVPVQDVPVEEPPAEELHSAPEEWAVNEPEATAEVHHEEQQTHHEEVQTEEQKIEHTEAAIEPTEASNVETEIEHEYDRVGMAPVEDPHTDTAQPTEQPVEEEAATPEPTAVEPAATEQIIVEPAAPEPELVFQSYHTVDYFASQGIKFSAEENPSDRLGKQLKSFTAWLKVMKRLPQRPGAAGELTPDIVGEHKIQAIAAHSVEGREPVTETMAEVLEKQGMWQKAADVYHKLSLLNPDKSSYFAAKIGEIQSRFNQTEPGN